MLEPKIPVRFGDLAVGDEFLGWGDLLFSAHFSPPTFVKCRKLDAGTCEVLGGPMSGSHGLHPDQLVWRAGDLPSS